MENNQGEKNSPDLNRYGERLTDYLLAMVEFNRALLSIKKLPSHEISIEDSLIKILPALRKAFSSEIGFLANRDGEIYATFPETNNINGKKLPLTAHVKEIIENGKTFVADTSSPNSQELQKLKVKSLLIIRIITPIALRLIGVANGRNAPFPYLSEDKKFFSELMKIFSFGLSYLLIKQKQERYHFSNRYRGARLLGDWENLARASEDYARSLINSERPDIADKNNVLSDYMDAKLASYLQTQSNTPFKKMEDSSSRSDEDEEIILHKGPNRSALAAARIFLCAGYLKRMPEFTSDNIFKSTEIKNMDTNVDPEQMWINAETILTNKIPLNKQSGTHDDIKSDLDFYVDLLRTRWLKIYFMACQGIPNPLPKQIKIIGDLYASVWKLTVQVIQIYLEDRHLDANLRIDSDWLISWLTSNVLLSKRLNEFYELKPEVAPTTTGKGAEKETEANPIARMRYLKHLSHQILFVLHCTKYANRETEIKKRDGKAQYKRPPFADIPAEPDTNLSESQLYIMTEYTYREIGVHRELRIFERLNQQLTYELPLYGSSNFYRDHLFHVLDVCLLGEFLLKSLQPNGMVSVKYNLLSETLSKENLDRLLKNWYVAALCHDLGYVIEQSEKFIQPIDNIKGEGLSHFSNQLQEGLKKGKEEIQKTIQKIVDSQSSDIPSALAKKLIDDHISTDHGVAAWLHLRQWLLDVKVPLDDFQPALTAILRHNLSDQEIDIKKEPLSFLLILCDHLQEWGRPIVGMEYLSRQVMEGLRFGEKHNVEKKIRMSEIHLAGLMPEIINRKKVLKKTCENCVSQGHASLCQLHCLRTQAIINKEKGITFTLPHNEAREADFEPCISWLMFCRDLQSINYNKQSLPFDMTIRFKHAQPRIWMALDWKPLEMDILDEYANTNTNDHHHAAYLCEWIKCARQGVEGIKYERNRDEGTEEFIIYLHKLEKPLKRGLAEEHWQPFFHWKWKWLSQKYTTQNLGSWYPKQE